MTISYWDLEEETGRLRRDMEREHEKTRRDMADAFNRIATALEGLTDEVRALRADLNPSLDKPRKMPAPKGGS